MPADGSYPVRGRPQPQPSHWVRRDCGPVGRPYAVTGGRTEPVDGEVQDVVAVVAAVTGGGAVNVVRQRPTAGERPGNNVLQELLNGLRAL